LSNKSPSATDRLGPSTTHAKGEDPKTTPELIKLRMDATEAFADLIENPGDRTPGKAQITTATLLEKEELRGKGNLSSDSLGELIRAIVQFQILVQPTRKGEALSYWRQKEAARNS
jgi:hypothetical protein